MLGAVHGSFASWTAVAAGAFLTGADDRANCTFGINDAERVPRSLEDIDVALSIDRDGAGIHERSLGCHGAVLGNAALAIAGNCAHHPGPQLDHADAAVVEVGEIEFFVGRIEGRTIDTAE